MSWLIYLFGSGLAFFAGVALVLAALALFPRFRGDWRASLLTILTLVGLAVIGLSAAPLSYWYYGMAGLVTLAWLAMERGQTPTKTREPVTLRWATAAVWLGAVLLELPYHFSPSLEAAGNPPLYVIGDSLTAGDSRGEKQSWPDLLPESVEVHNFARVGATTASACDRQCGGLPRDGGLVLVAIGGNDLLGDTPAAQFERDLEQLLKRVAAPGRTVVMFELPLPPLSNEYGRIQRRLAARYDVRLIPKRILMSILAADGTTLDSIHLSPAGHERMAAAVWNLIAPAYQSPTLALGGRSSGDS